MPNCLSVNQFYNIMTVLEVYDKSAFLLVCRHFRPVSAGLPEWCSV